VSELGSGGSEPPSASAPLLSVRDLSVERDRRLVLKGITFEAQARERIAVVGPNAAGKTTLLLAIAGQLGAKTGGVRLRLTPAQEAGLDVIDVLRANPRTCARHIALVTAVPRGGSGLTVFEAAMLGRYPALGAFSRPTGADVDLVEAALRETGVDDLGSRPLRALSAGERQRASIARGLAQSPRILLLDEPGAHLDVGHALDLYETLKRVAARETLVIAVIHDLAQAARWATRLLVLDSGALVLDAAPESAMKHEALGRVFGVRVEVLEQWVFSRT
jgi:iron complex transport system ATP-binding protein